MVSFSKNKQLLSNEIKLTICLLMTSIGYKEVMWFTGRIVNKIQLLINYLQMCSGRKTDKKKMKGKEKENLKKLLKFRQKT